MYSTPLSKAGADPGFPVGGGADPLGGGATYDFVKFSQKLHEIEKILGRGGGAPPAPPWIRHCKEMLTSRLQNLEGKVFLGIKF